MPLDLLATVVEEAQAPVVVETPGGVDDHIADIAFVRAHTSKARAS
jgi:deoxyribonuclease-4